MKRLLILTFLCMLLRGTLAFAQEDPSMIGYGDQREGQLSAVQPEQIYRFKAAQGDSISVTLTALEETLDPMLILLDGARQSVLAVDNDSGGGRNARLRYVIPVDGVYVITAVKAQGSEGGRFRLDLSLTNPTPVPAGAITTPLIAPIFPGITKRGTLSTVAGIAIYALMGKGGGSVRVELAADLGLDASLYLFTGDLRTRIAAGQGTILEAVIPADGAYFVVVSRTGGEGSFSLNATYAPLADVSVPDLPVLIPGQSVGAVIDLDFARVFRFGGDQGTAVRFDLDATQGLDVLAVLADAGFNQIAVSAGSLPRALLPATGIYYLIVMRRAGVSDPGTGSFSLTLSGAPPETPLESIGYGQAVSDEISDSRYRVEYVFQAAAGDGIVIHMDAAPGSRLDPLVMLLDSTGVILAANDDRAAGLVNSSTPYQFTEGGRYVVVATRQGEAVGKSSGAYRLQIERRNAPTSTPLASPTESSDRVGSPAAPASRPTVQPIRYGDTLSGTISDQTPLSYFVFRGEAGESVEIRLSQSSGYSLDPMLYLYLYSEGGQPELIGGNDDLPDGFDGEAGITITLPTTGDYLIVATRKGAASGGTVGNFVLFLKKVD